MTTTEEQVHVLLDLAGIAPSREEVDQLVTTFPRMRESLERIWAVDVADDIAPSLVFRAAEATGPQEMGHA